MTCLELCVYIDLLILICNFDILICCQQIVQSVSLLILQRIISTLGKGG